MPLAHWVHDWSPFLIRFSENFGIRYYGLAYLAGFAASVALLWLYWKSNRSPFGPNTITDLVTTLIIGVLLGGRLGYFLLYQLDSVLADPLVLIRVWEGGMASHGGVLPFGGTFLVFSDYMRGAVRVAAIMGVDVTYVWTHDSIGLGEDGPTHQPVEQTASLRLIPNMDVWRPCDTTESAVAWAASIERRDGPSSLAFSRQNLPFQARSAEQVAAIRRGGYKIVTTLDAPLQKAATETLMKKIPPTDDSQVATSAVTVQPGTGQVLTIAQNTIFNPQRGKPGQTELNFGVDKVYGGAAGFQVGSTFKPFTLATWLSKGKGLFTNVTGDQQWWNGRDFRACGESLGTGRFKVSNSEGSGPPAISVMQATFNSVNLAYMDMASRLDLCDITKTAEAMGVHLASPPTETLTQCYKDGIAVPGKLPTQCPSIILGALLISPLTMANAYATFAAEGTYCPPTPVLSILDRSGKAQSVGATKCVSEAIPANVARGVIYAGKKVFTDGTARGRGIRWPAAGKTGTTDDSVRTWFVGYTKQLATAVVVADPKDYPEHPGGKSLNNRRIGGVNYGHVFGATIAAPLWQSIMNIGMDGLPREDWPAPPAKMLEGSGIKVAEVVGRTIDEATGILQAQGFKVRVGPPTASFIERGIHAGLRGLRALLHAGYGSTDSTAAPGFPVLEITKAIDLDISKGVEPPAIVFSTADVPVLPAPDWKLLRCSVCGPPSQPRAMSSSAMMVALRGLGALRHVPYQQYGAVTTVDRDEIEDLRSGGISAGFNLASTIT